MKKNIDLNHEFPHFEKLSRIVPGEERIHQNVLVKEPISGPPCGLIHTMFEALERAESISNNGNFLGELTHDGYKWSSYGVITKNVKILGSALRHIGEHPGGMVGLAGIHSVRYITAMHAMVAQSLTIVPLYHNSKLATLCEIAKNCKLSTIFCDTMSRALLLSAAKKNGQLPNLKRLILLSDEEVASNNNEDIKIEFYAYDKFFNLGKENSYNSVPPCPDDVYVICHTSGTTGKPKGVMMTHRNLLAGMAGLYTQWVLPPNRFHFDHTDIYFSFLSLAHVYEHLMQAFVIYIGASVGVYRGDINKLVTDIQILKPTILSLVPRLLNRFHDHIHAEISKKGFLAKAIFSIAKKKKLELLHEGEQRYDTFWDKIMFDKLKPIFGGRLRMLTTGGAPVIPGVKEFTRIAYGCPLMEGYGQTECAAAGTLNLPFEYISTPVGGPAPWAQIKLIDVPEMEYYAKNDMGEICFRGAAVMKGYFNEPELTAQTIDEEGWLHTGDIGRWKEDGGLEVIDRKNALFKMAQGDFVSPEQIEATYMNSALINQLFTVGRTTRSFLVGIVHPNINNLREALGKSELSSKAVLPQEEILKDSDVCQWFLTVINSTAKVNGLQSIEILRNIVLIDHEWSAENGLVTPTLKLKRSELKKKYEKEIEEMYSSITLM